MEQSIEQYRTLVPQIAQSFPRHQYMTFLTTTLEEN